MNPPDQPTLAPTPRTDAAASKSDGGIDSFGKAVPSNFARTLERELAAAKAECDLNRTRLASIFWSGAMDKFTGGDVQKWAADYTAELARLRAEVQRQSRVNAEVVGEASRQVAASDNLFREARAEVERLKGALALGQQNCDDAYDDLREERDEAIARAEKAEAALADWSVLKGWGGTPEIVHKFIKGQQNRIHHCQDLEAELASERARLDYLALQMGTPRVADALDLDYSLCFPIRVAIIPLDDIEAIVERACNAHWREAGGAAMGRFDYRDGIRAALTAAGIPCKRKAHK